MKVLFIGGTGLISSACSQLAVDRGIDLFILNRGRSRKYDVPAGAHLLVGDVHADRAAVAEMLNDHHFDAVVDWIAFTPADIEADIALFTGRTRQFIFISSASVYQKPPNHYLITEDTPLANPHWAYSQNKIACEERLMREYRERGFPITIIRPSLTYGPSQIPIVMGSWQHPWTIVERMKQGRPVIVPGDGTSLWPLTWNGDFARGLVGLLGREQAIGHAFHITSDEVLNWNQIYIELAHALGVEPKLVHIPSDLIAAFDPDSYGSLIGDKIYSVVFDNSKIKRFVPDFVATVPWTAGVRKALAWFEADPARQSIDAPANRLWDNILTAYERAWPAKQ
ncbi:MAG: SDR family oxidoreductase [Chloroflexi bacterium]|nr:SDR family oxidoreductase [Chloroflexota bacterium]MCL5275212.1 SDR family oxidoreductase [Chloroflexota bacterium]